jgi:hypothetical protein
MNRIYGYAVAVLLLVSCAPKNLEHTHNDADQMAQYADSIPYLRMTQIGALSLFSAQLNHFRTNDSAVSFTRLGHEELVEVEYLLRKYVGENYKYLDLDQYYRQYVGFRDEKGDRIAWVNFFCDEAKEPWWRYGLRMVNDGGDCYFKIKINLTDGQVVYMMVNGGG